MPGPQPEPVLAVEQRPEKRQAAHVVEMRVREIDIGVEAHVVQRAPEVADAGAGVEKQHAIGAAHLERRRVAAIARGTRPGAGDRAAYAPEADGKGCLVAHALEW